MSRGGNRFEVAANAELQNAVRRDRHHQRKRVGQEGLLLQLDHEAVVGGIVGILVQPVMELGRGGQGETPQPQKEHEPDGRNGTHPACARSRWSSGLHTAAIQGPLAQKQA